jgi:probable O-glycosylation ligase (exosortase A-associated)
MRDLAFIVFLLGLLTLGIRRPFLFVLAYVYVDTVSPQRLSYYLLNSIPLSMIVAVLALGGWVMADRKVGLRVTARQVLIVLLLAYAGVTTLYADFPVDAAEKWDWAWKALAFAIFLPFTLHSRLRIEAVILFLILSAGSIIIVGGLKTVLSGGGYGVLNLMVDNNSGLYESSTISTIAIALIPLILWAGKHGTIFPPDWRVKLFIAGLIFACLLMPIGTEARTGLLCIGVLAILMLRDAKRRLLYITGAAVLGLAAIPFLPSSFTNRMETIQGFQGDQSANTRLAVWAWTLDYAQAHPFGGGFGAYRSNKIQVQTVNVDGGVTTTQVEADEGRAYHSSYFEMLGEQGYPGLAIFLLIHGIGLVRMEVLRRRYRRETGERAWIAPLATALQHFHLIYLVGCLFVGIAYQSFGWLVLAVQIGLDTHCARLRKGEAESPRFGRRAAGDPSAANHLSTSSA